METAATITAIVLANLSSLHTHFAQLDTSSLLRTDWLNQTNTQICQFCANIHSVRPHHRKDQFPNQSACCVSVSMHFVVAHFFNQKASKFFFVSPYEGCVINLNVARVRLAMITRQKMKCTLVTRQQSLHTSNVHFALLLLTVPCQRLCHWV